MNKQEIAKLSRLDPQLACLIKKVGALDFNLKKQQAPYEALVEAVVYQQLTGKAAATILGRVKALYPHRRFPTPEDLLETPVEKLRSAGLSGAKTAAIRDIAAKALDGTIPTLRRIQNMTEEEIIERLTAIRGVGRWTVEMFLIFRLGRTDVWPVTDYGVRKGFARLMKKKKLPTPKQLDQHGEKWRPHRTTAALYLWRALDTQ